MPISALWSLVICLAGLALGLAYKVAELTHRSDRLNKEAETLRSELDTLQKSKNKEISYIKATHQTELKKIVEHNKPLKETDNNLTEVHEKVLELLFQKPSPIENLCKTLNLTREEAKFYLFDLCDNKSMVNHPAPYSTGPEAWLISQKGREYIMAKRGKV